MTNTSADLLEFESLRTLLGRYVGCALGREELAAVAPSTDRASLTETHALNQEAMEYLKTAASPQTASRGAAVRLRFSDIPDCREAARKLRIEGVALEGKQIFDLAGLLDRVTDARAILLAASARFPKLAAKGNQLSDMRPLVSDLSGKILPDGTLADTASVALGRIRKAIERQRREIESSLERFLRAHRADGVLQEDFVTLRNDRFVVPIVSGQQARVQGVIHGSSGSGHTMFVEPLDTIQLNNQLVSLTEEELRESHRILRELTARLRSHAEEINRSLEVIGELDLLFAKAGFALDFDCTIPRFSPEETPLLKLEAARHPLLEDILRRQRKPIIPISFTLDPTRRTLLLSGPNTGGKTVSLKTTGLLALMAQAGIPVPARDAEFPVFDQILADVGDNQSLAESLSSFSAHIRRIREILSIVTPDSLVLLDELGRATDPEEGGALGVAIVDFLRGWKAFTLASTHLLALKVYGGSRDGVVNGSMGFDHDTLEPTYLLKVGAPGDSAGLAIASRLGMPPELIEKARAGMSNRERELTDFLSRLQQQVAALADEKRLLEEQRRALADREKAVAAEWERKESAKLKELDRRVEEVLRKFEDQSGALLESIAEGAQQKKAGEQAQRKVSKAMREFKEEFQSVVRPQSEPQPHLNVVEGARVRLKDIRGAARVRRLLGDGRIEVEAGLMKLQVMVEDVVEVLPEAAESSRLPANVSFQSAGPRWDISYRELNLIGKRAEEAVEELDRFLDQAVMAEVDRIRIVHGHGMGVLKKAVSEHLSKSPHVAKYYAASPSEGGTGATVAELKES
ncbi:MAG: Smr/MutS family protein [Bryobacteraceae bacterium]|nr:Smr/MutS family protein [Bryobacteraceae bacterium]